VLDSAPTDLLARNRHPSAICIRTRIKHEGGEHVSIGRDGVDIAKSSKMESIDSLQIGSRSDQHLRHDLRQDCQQSCKELASISVCDTTLFRRSIPHHAVVTPQTNMPRVPSKNKCLPSSKLLQASKAILSFSGYASCNGGKWQAILSPSCSVSSLCNCGGKLQLRCYPGTSAMPLVFWKEASPSPVAYFVV